MWLSAGVQGIGMVGAKTAAEREALLSRYGLFVVVFFIIQLVCGGRGGEGTEKQNTVCFTVMQLNFSPC